jgi:hypothetical protein
MTNQNTPRRWNLFARTLEDILAAYNLGLEQLSDRAGIDSEKVRRLVQSLRTPKSFPVLNTEEMDLVIRTLQLGDEEVLQLRAALLATSIEKMLIDRINQDDALLVAEQSLPLILKALREQVSGITGLGGVRGGDGGSDEDDALDTLLEWTRQLVDKAEMALHMSRHVNAHGERVERAREARTHYEEALAELEEADNHIRALRVWQNCYKTVQKGLATANERLEDLGE